MGGIETKTIVDINRTANKYQSSIILRTDGKNLDAKSILGLSITLLKSQTYRLEINGQDEKEAKSAMAAVFQKHGLAVEFI
jgi:phosphocarrier protein HPr